MSSLKEELLGMAALAREYINLVKQTEPKGSSDVLFRLAKMQGMLEAVIKEVENDHKDK